MPFSIVLRNNFFFLTFNAAAFMKKCRQLKSILFQILSLRDMEPPAVVNPEEALMCISISYKKQLCAGAFVAVLYLFVRVNSTVCSTSRVKSCK